MEKIGIIKSKKTSMPYQIGWDPEEGSIWLQYPKESFWTQIGKNVFNEKNVLSAAQICIDDQPDLFP